MLLFLQNTHIVIFRREKCSMSTKCSQGKRYTSMIYLMSVSLRSCSSNSSPHGKERHGQLVAVNLSISVTHSSQMPLQKAQEQTLSCFK